MTGIDPVFAWLVRLGLATLFGAASMHKLRDARAFTTTLRDYRVLPPAAVPPVSALVIGAEILVAVALVSPAADPLGSWLALALLSAYSGAIALNLARGRREIDCGCLGPGRGQPLTPWLLARNAVLAIGLFLLLVPEAPRSWVWVDAMTVAGGLSMLVLLWTAAHALGAAAVVPGRLS